MSAAWAKRSRFVVDDNDRAGRVVNAMGAHRAEQRACEPAVTSAAHDEEVGSLGLGQQDFGRVSFEDRCSTGTCGHSSETGATIDSNDALASLAQSTPDATSAPVPYPVGARQASSATIFILVASACRIAQSNARRDDGDPSTPTEPSNDLANPP
jgi:hypothetical protein